MYFITLYADSWARRFVALQRFFERTICYWKDSVGKGVHTSQHLLLNKVMILAAVKRFERPWHCVQKLADFSELSQGCGPTILELRKVVTLVQSRFHSTLMCIRNVIAFFCSLSPKIRIFPRVKLDIRVQKIVHRKISFIAIIPWKKAKKACITCASRSCYK